ncbi:MAG TPA: GntR family transcriptional regulator [Chthonomonadaceae bacterium]|nr:GntR family transcriptional regulator [Chthonomonadaceae bacterium]
MNRNPAVPHILTTLRERIEGNAYQPGTWLPTERALSEEFGVDRSVIRTVLAELIEQGLVVRSQGRRPWVSENIQPKITKIDRHATALVTQAPTSAPPRIAAQRRSLGLSIWPNPTDPVSASVAQGICKAIDLDTYRLVIDNLALDSWEEILQSEARFLERMVEDRDIAGVLLWLLGGKDSLPALQKVRAANIPIVFLDRRPPFGFEADYVGVDNEFAAEQAVNHLLALGHRRIAHITNGDYASTVVERMNGYRRALEKAKIPFDLDLIGTVSEGWREARYTAMLDRLLSLPEPPTAMFAVNDVLADRCMKLMRERGLRIPEDMAVVGFDGIERWRPGEPFLTTVHQPFELIGMRAADLLLQRIEGRPPAAYQHILLPASLSIHGSTLIERRDNNTSR